MLMDLYYFQTGKAPYYVGAAQTLPRGHVYGDRSKNSIGKVPKQIATKNVIEKITKIN